MPSLAPVLVGRAAETERLRRLLDAARQGRSGALVLSGEPGIGKSALLRAARAQAAGEFTVLEAGGVEAEADLPFAGLQMLLAPLLDDLDAIPRAQAAALRGALALAPVESMQRFAAYAAVLALMAERAPLLCVIDDAHWLDRDSQAALLFTARRLEADAVVLLFAARPGTFAAPLDVLEVGPLPPDAAIALIPDAAREVAARLVEETGGNPLAVLEGARRLTPAQLAGHEVLVGPLPIGPTAERQFRHRIEALAPAGRRALLVAAALTDGNLATILAALGGDTVGLEQAEAAGLITLDCGRMSFTHPLSRSAVYGTASAAERRAAHGALAQALDGDRAVWHRAAATLGADDAVAEALESTALAASRRAGFGFATDTLERAAALTADADARARRLMLAADGARQSGQAERAERLLTAAADTARETTLTNAIERARGRLALMHGRPADARSRLARLAEHVAPAEAAALLAEAAFAAMIAGDGLGAVMLSLRAQDLAPPPPIVELVLGMAQFRSGQTTAGLKLVMQATARIEASADIEPEQRVLAGHVLAWIGEHRRAHELLDHVVRDARAAGALGVLPWALYAVADLETRVGRWSTARAAAWDAARIAEDAGNAFWRAYALSCIAWLDAAQGRENDCHAAADECERIARALAVECPRKVADARGLLELGLGRPEQAIPHFAHAGSRLAMADMVEAHVRAQRELPPQTAAEIAEMASDSATPNAIVLRCQALLADDQAFAERFTAALAAHHELDLPFSRARTQLAFGERLRRAGRRVESREPLRAAIETFTRLEAGPWAGRAESEMRATGETVRRREAFEWERLTPQELQVSQLVAQGATNREAAATLFISPKTVEYHLKHVFRKLGVRSRTELAHRLAGDRAPA